MKSGVIRNYLVSADVADMNQKLYLICVHVDITDHIRAENALRQSEEKFSKVFQGSPIMMTLSSLEEGIFINANEAFYTGMGYTCDEIIGKPITGEINFFADTEKCRDLEKMLLRRGKLESVEIDFRTKTGEIRHGILWSQLLYLNEKLCRITSLIDITEQKRIEQEMARLSDLNLIGEMAASIGHEIRNPMTSVRGFLQMFKDKYIEDREFLDLMIEEMDRANEIISEFLGMAKNKIVYLEPQYIDQVVKAIYPMLEADANYKGMKINLDLGKPPMTVIDQKEIRQVIINLARNGLEAMLSGGTLTIGTTVEENEIVLYVKDEGPGMKPEDIEKIGKPFFTTKETGTGLGLAVCYSIAARHNARLEVETGQKGTTFKMKFPKHKEVEMA
jgi:PAS domain S-box-containing protein